MPIICFAAWAVIAASPCCDPRFAAASNILAQAQIGRDPASLIRYLHQRTPDAARSERIDLLIRRLGDPRFAIRSKASDELSAIGTAAEKALEAALADADAERADRASRCLKAIRDESETPATLAVLHLLSYSGSHEAVGTIFAYLPFANEPDILKEALDALVRLGMKEGKAIPEVPVWAADSNAVRRSFAGHLLGRSSDSSHQQISLRLLKDPDASVRLRTAEGMLYAGKESAVPVLIELLDPGDPDRFSSAQWLLSTLFGNSFPEAPLSVQPKEWSRYRQMCQQWWLANEAGIDTKKLRVEGRPLGLVIGIEYMPGRIWACGPDGRRLWDFHANCPTDARWISDRKILVAERNPDRVYECDRTGKITWEKPLPVSPVTCDRMPNGNIFIGSFNEVLEMRTDGTIVSRYKFPIGGMNGIRRLPNGHFVGIDHLGVIAELDAKGKLLYRVQAPKGSYLDVACNIRGNYVVNRVDKNQLLEIDRKGKVVATIEGKPRMCGLDILQDGTIMVTAPGRAFILGWDGKVRKEYKGETEGCRRAHMR